MEKKFRNIGSYNFTLASKQIILLRLRKLFVMKKNISELIITMYSFFNQIKGSKMKYFIKIYYEIRVMTKCILKMHILVRNHKIRSQENLHYLQTEKTEHSQ